MPRAGRGASRLCRRRRHRDRPSRAAQPRTRHSIRGGARRKHRARQPELSVGHAARRDNPPPWWSRARSSRRGGSGHGGSSAGDRARACCPTSTILRQTRNLAMIRIPCLRRFPARRQVGRPLQSRRRALDRTDETGARPPLDDFICTIVPPACLSCCARLGCLALSR